jgi:hypothetical protein
VRLTITINPNLFFIFPIIKAKARKIKSKCVRHGLVKAQIAQQLVEMEGETPGILF